ncbi:MAG: hypothetical protein QFB87_01560 [Patescibacteria group bacterium]|nr:hypothetical protein [Patescibacteria group bacterium]
MSSFGKISIIVGFCITTTLLPGTVAADTLAVPASQIQIAATVLPNNTVIIDSAGAVLQITSNTSLPNVEPTVYLNTIAAANLVLPTPQVKDQINLLLKNKTMKPGVLYRRPLLVVSLPNNPVLTLLQPVAKT